MRTAGRLAVLCATLVASSCSKDSTGPPIPMTFNGTSRELNATEVVPTLDTPIPDGKNAIWCASFQAAWKALEELAGEPISLEASPGIAGLLNGAPDPRPHIPPASLYVAAGWNHEGVTNQIQNELKQRFPNKQSPTFPGILPESFVAYSYVEANVKFPLPYDQNPRPMTFTEANGKKIQIHSFGTLRHYHRPRDRLLEQPRVLFRQSESLDASFEFAIDLCSNSFPSQIVVARIAREPTLAAAVARVEKQIARMPEVMRAEAARSGQQHAERLQRIDATDALLVPDLHWAISHHFIGIEVRVFRNAKLKPQRFDVAQQDILFRLDRSGAALKSEAKAYYRGRPTEFSFDRPFLVYMKQRGAPMPYFAMWVDNGELLRAWRGTEEAGK